MLLMIDNYDSFTYNLAQYLQELGREVTVYRNDMLGLDAIRALKPEAIIISPGPGDPDQAGISLEVILRTVFGVEGALGAATRAHLESALGGFSPIYLFSKALQRRFMPGWRRFLEAREGLSRLVREAVDARRAASAM